MLHVITNPYSSSGQGHRRWERVRPLFEEAGIPFQLHSPSETRTIEEICAELTAPGQAEEVRLCVIGGDGTMNAVVNGIRDFANTRVGFIQGGSGNDLACGLELPKDPLETARRIIQGEVLRCCDVGEVLFYNRFEELDPLTHLPVEPEDMEKEKTVSAAGPLTRRREKADEQDLCAHKPVSAGKEEKSVPTVTRFNVSAGIGFDAAVCQQANASGFKRVLNRMRLGKLAYVGVACGQILFSPACRMKILLKTKDETKVLRLRRALFVALMNTRCEGGGFAFAPDADPHDGLLNLCGADGISRASFFRILPHAYNGTHLKYKGVVMEKGASITIRTEIPLWVHTDGEVTCKSSHIRVRVKKQALRLMC